MEIKKEKKTVILKVISMFLSIVITLICIWVYHKRLSRMIYIPQNAITISILFLMFIFTLYIYINAILNLLRNKKIIKALILSSLIIFSVIGIIFIKDNVNYLFRNVILMLVFILGIICLPLIILGKFILENDNKYKKIKILLISVVIFYTYIINWECMVDYAQKIVITLSENSTRDLISLREEEKIDTSYLYNYTQKLAKKGYLSQWDIKQIIDIADSKSSIIWINYKDEIENIQVNIKNKDDNEIQKLIESLKAEYYNFNYNINENNEVVINISRYTVDNYSKKEKNEDIVLKGIKNDTIVKNVNYYVSEDHESFVFENQLDVENIAKDNAVKAFKVLFVYDKEKNNFLPVVEDIREYELMDSYIVYQSGIDIYLKEDIDIENKDYTIRINRYDDNLKLTNHSTFYEYEPVVTEMTAYKNRKVLEMRFNREYSIDEVKNIEIIFGK